VRPRTKEFLIGYPLLWLALGGVLRGRVRGWTWFVAALGTVAPISVINSFCHVHTPLWITLQRSLWGLFLGFLCGIGLELCLRGGRWLLKKSNVA
jgi:hypothetical protein